MLTKFNVCVFKKIFFKFRVWEDLLVAEKCVLRFVPCHDMSMVLSCSLCSQTDTERREPQSGVKCYPVSFYLVVGFLFNCTVP